MEIQGLYRFQLFLEWKNFPEICSTSREVKECEQCLRDRMRDEILKNEHENPKKHEPDVPDDSAVNKAERCNLGKATSASR